MPSFFCFLLPWLKSKIFSDSLDEKTFFTEGHNKHMRWGFESMKCPDPHYLLWYELQDPDTQAGIPGQEEENIFSTDRQEGFSARTRTQESTPEPQEPCRVCLSLSATCSHRSFQGKSCCACFQAINSGQQFHVVSSETHIPIPVSNYQLSPHKNLLKLVCHINTQVHSHSPGQGIPGLIAC